MDEFIEFMADIRRRVERLEKNMERSRVVLPATGVLIIPVDTSDPASPTNGQMWVNSTSGQFKIRIGGVTKVVTIT